MADIVKHGFHVTTGIIGDVTTGIIGTRAIYEALAKNGRMDVALKMLSQTDFPSYGYMVSNADEPATTLWEKWGASQLQTDQADASRNHVSPSCAQIAAVCSQCAPC